MNQAAGLFGPVPQAARVSRGIAWASRSPWAVAGTVFAIFGLWLAGMYARGYDARNSIVLGTRYVQMSHRSSVIRYDPTYRYPGGPSGYDGQFFYFIAVDPLRARYYMDSPSYRYTKILYPVVARLLALGQAGLVPFALILTNWLAIAATAGALGAWLRRKGMSPWFALVYALCPGVWVSFERDLTEPLSYALVITAVYFYDFGGRYRWASSGILFALAILARDKAAIFAGIYGAGMLLSGADSWVEGHWQGWRDRRALEPVGGEGTPKPRVVAPAQPQLAADVMRTEDGTRTRRVEAWAGEGAAPRGESTRGANQDEDVREHTATERRATGLRATSTKFARDAVGMMLRNGWKAAAFGAIALGPYLAWRRFVQHWLHAAGSVSGVSTSYQAAPLSGVLTSALSTATKVMYLFVLFIPALLCAGMALWAVVRRVWAVPVALLLVLIEVSVVSLNVDYFVDVYGVLRVEAGVILAATLCLPYFGRLTRGNSLWFYACSGGWLLLTVGYMAVAPAWLLAGRA